MNTDSQPNSPHQGRPPHGQTSFTMRGGGAGGGEEEAQLQLSLASPLESPSTSTRKGGRPASSKKASKSGRQILNAIRKEAGNGLKVLSRVQKLYPGDPMRQITEFFDGYVIPAATGRKRTVSIKTEALYLVQMRVMVAQLRELNMPIQNLGELGPRHVAALTRHYEKQGMSASTLQKKNTVLRRFGTWIGKPDMTPRLKDLVNDPTRAMRSYSAVVSKAWSANGVDPDEVFNRVELMCPIAGLQLRIQHAFGLRPREVVMLKPISADQGKNLFITDGTKGGRARMVPIDTPRKRELLEQAKAIAAGNNRGILTDRPSQSMHKALNRFYYVARAAGITRAGLGVTLHGLRHEFANDMFQQITGVPSPVNGGRVEDTELVRHAMQTTSEQLGHSRRHAGAAYLGSTRHMEYSQRKNLYWLIGKLESNLAVLEAVRRCGPSSWWVIGPAAAGKPIRGPWTLAYRAEVSGSTSQADADRAIAADAMAVAFAASASVGQPASLIPESMVSVTPMAHDADDLQHERLELPGLWQASIDQPKAA